MRSPPLPVTSSRRSRLRATSYLLGGTGRAAGLGRVEITGEIKFLALSTRDFFALANAALGTFLLR